MTIADRLKRFLGLSSTSDVDGRESQTHPHERRQRAHISDELDDVEITDSYRHARQLLDDGVPIIFVTGAAGTGKSTCVRYLRRHPTKQIAVLAPTGVAALNVQGSTIHSFFRFPSRILLPGDIKEVDNKSVYQNLDVLILDEASMIRADIIDGIDQFLRRNGRHHDKPFGGTQIVLVGDMHQLPPIVAPEEKRMFAQRYASEFFFSAEALADQQIVPVELTRAFRQQDDAYIQILNRLRTGESSSYILDEINNRVIHADLSKTVPIVLTLSIHEESKRSTLCRI